MIELRPGQSVTLMLPSGSHAARLTACSATSCELVLVAAPGAPLPSGQPVAIAFATPAGQVRRPGRVVSDDGAGALLIESAGADEVVQRRRHVRVDATLDVEVRLVDRPDLELRTLTRDVSAGGALLAGPTALRVGDAAWLALLLDRDAAPVEALAECVRTGGRGARAMMFTVIADSDRERLVRFAFARQRQARRMARGG